MTKNLTTTFERIAHRHPLGGRDSFLYRNPVLNFPASLATRVGTFYLDSNGGVHPHEKLILKMGKQEE